MKSLKRSGERPLGARMPPDAFSTGRSTRSLSTLSNKKGVESTSDNDKTHSNDNSSSTTTETTNTTSTSNTTLQQKQKETQNISPDSQPRSPTSISLSQLKAVSPQNIPSSSEPAFKSPSQKSEKMSAISKSSVKKFVSTFENTNSTSGSIKSLRSPLLSATSPKSLDTSNSSSDAIDFNNYTLTRKTTTSSVSSTTSIDSIGKALQDLPTIPIQQNTFIAKSSDFTTNNASSSASSLNKISLSESPSTTKPLNLSGSSSSPVSMLSAKFESPKKSETKLNPAGFSSPHIKPFVSADTTEESATSLSTASSSFSSLSAPMSPKKPRSPISAKSPVFRSTNHVNDSTLKSIGPIDEFSSVSPPCAKPVRPSSVFSKKTNSDVKSVASSIVDNVISTTVEDGSSSKAIKANPYSAVPFSHKLQEKIKSIETPSIDHYATKNDEGKHKSPKYEIKQTTDISLSSSIRASNAGVGSDDDDNDDESNYAMIPNIKTPAWVTELKNQQNKATSSSLSNKTLSPVSKHKKSFSDDSSRSSKSTASSLASEKVSPSRTPVTSRTNGKTSARPVSPVYSHSPTRELNMLRAGNSSPTRPARPSSASSIRSWNNKSDQETNSATRNIPRPNSAASHYSMESSSKMVTDFLESRVRPDSPTRMSPKRTPVTPRTSSPVSSRDDKSNQTRINTSRPNSRLSLDSRISSKREDFDKNRQPSPVTPSRATSVRTFYSAVSEENSSSNASLSRAETISYGMRSNSPPGRYFVDKEKDEAIPLVPQFEKTFDMFNAKLGSTEDTEKSLSDGSTTEENDNMESNASSPQSIVSVSGSVSSRSSTSSTVSSIAARALQASPKLGKTPLLPPPSPAVSMQSLFSNATSATSFYDAESIYSVDINNGECDDSAGFKRTSSIISSNKQHPHSNIPATIPEKVETENDKPNAPVVANECYRNDSILSSVSRVQSVTSNTSSTNSRNFSGSSDMSRVSIQTQMTDPELSNISQTSGQSHVPQALSHQNPPVTTKKTLFDPDLSTTTKSDRFDAKTQENKPYYYLDFNTMKQQVGSDLSFWGPSGAPFANKDPRDVTVFERLLLDSVFCDILVCYIFIVFIIA